MQWEAWRQEQGKPSGADSDARAAKPAQKSAAQSTGQAAAKKKLSYLEQREYDEIEGRVEAADARLFAARDRIEHPAVVTDAKALTDALDELDAAQSEHDALYERWAALTEKLGG
jgi:ATP-binding cassette subfamily F protein uup